MLPHHTKTKDGVPLTLRRAVPSDAAAIIAHVEKVSGESDNLTFGRGEFGITLEQETETLARAAEGDAQLFAVAIIRDEIIGLLNLAAAGNRARRRHVGELGMDVEAEHWGKGVGAALLDAAIAWGRGGGRAGADMREMQRNIVELTREPIPQIDDPTRIGLHAIYNYYFGMHLASEGDDEALRYAPILEAQPLYATLGLQIRRHHALMTGNYREALRFRRQRELLALQSETSDHHLHMSLLREMGSALACADVLELARTTSAIKRKAARFAGWQPWLTSCGAAQHFLAREYARALELADEGLRAVPPFSHSAFHSFVSIKADALNELGEYAQAERLLADTIAGARAIGIRIDKESRLHAALALAAVGLGEAERGLSILEEQLQAIGQQPGKGSLLYAQLCETGCRIALMTNDLETFSRHYEPMSKLYARHPGLRAVAERWRRAGRDRFETRERQTGELHADIAVDWHTLIATAIGTQSSEERASYLLSLLLEQVEAERGQLYRIDPGGRPQLMASTPTPADPTLIVQAAKHCGSRTTTDITQTLSMTSDETTLDSAGRRYQLLWLVDTSDPERTHGLVMIGEPGASLGQITPALRNAITQHLRALG